MKVAFNVICTNGDGNIKKGRTYSVYYQNVPFGRIQISHLLEQNLDEEKITFREVFFKLTELENSRRLFAKWYESKKRKKYSFKLVENEYEVQLI